MRMGANDLQSVSKECVLSNMSALVEITFTALAAVGSLRLNDLPSIFSIKMEEDLYVNDEVEVANTSLYSLSGFRKYYPWQPNTS